MDRDFRHIQRVRRLVRDGRYNEARLIMKETNHPQIPALEKKVNQLAEIDSLEEPTRIFTRFSVLVGGIVGVISLTLSYGTGVRNIPLLAVFFLIGFGFGVVMPEHERRRAKTRDKYLKAFFKRLNSPYRR